MTQQTEFFRDSLADGHVEYVRPGLARRYDPETSHEAAAVISGKLTRLQARVMAAFEGREMTMGECERLPEFSGLAPSTIRKRGSECWHMGRLTECGKRDGMTVYRKT